MSRAKKRAAERVGATAEHTNRAYYRRYELAGVEPGEVLQGNFALDRQARRETYEPHPKDPASRARLRNMCAECGEQGHRAKQCPRRSCFKCGKTGHLRRDCPETAGS